MLAVNQYLCTSAEIKRRYGVLQTPVPTRHINATGQALLKFVPIVSPLYLSGCYYYYYYCFTVQEMSNTVESEVEVQRKELH